MARSADVKVENTFKKALCDSMQALRGDKIYIQKNHGSQFSSGLPDVEMNDFEFGMVWLELKALEFGKPFDWTKQPTALQFSVLTGIHKAGGRARLVIYRHEVKRVSCWPFARVDDMRRNAMVFKYHEFENFEVSKRALFGDSLLAKAVLWDCANIL